MVERVAGLSLIGFLLVAGQAEAQTGAGKLKAAGEKAASTRTTQTRARRSQHPSVQVQVEQLRTEMQKERSELLLQIEGLRQQLAESSEKATRAQQAADASVVAVKEGQHTAVASQEAMVEEGKSVATLQSSVAELKDHDAALKTSVQAVETKTLAAVERPASIRYKGVGITPGGFIAEETVWRQHDLQADMASPFNTIPFSGTAMGNMTEFRASARQTKMNLLVETKIGTAAVSGFLEMDLLGAGLTSNSTQSNSYLPRLRHAWMQSKWSNGWTVAAGQMWTLTLANRKGIDSASSNAFLPDMIDPQYVVGLTWVRQPSLRVVKYVGGGVSLAGSVDGAQTTLSARNAPTNVLLSSPGVANMTSTVNYTFDKAPDVVVKMAIDRGVGHYEVKGLGRFFRDRVYPGVYPSAVGAYNYNQVGGGVGASASWNVVKKVDISLNVLGGNGVGRYGTSQLPDTTVRPNGTLALIRGGQELGMLEFNPNAKLKLYAYEGAEYAGRTSFLGSNGLGVGYGSPLNDNTGCQTEVAASSSTTPVSGKCTADTRLVDQAVFGFWYRPYVGPMGKVQYGLQYSYTTRSTWSGVGGAPKAIENMFLTSMRYYLP